MNEDRTRRLGHQVRAHFGAGLAGKTLAVWGAVFEPWADDGRAMAELALLDELLEAGAGLRVHALKGLAHVRAWYGDRLTCCDRRYGALEGADGLVIVAECPAFRNPDFTVMQHLLRQPVVFDGHDLYEPTQLAAAGFTYYSAGRVPGTGRHAA